MAKETKDGGTATIEQEQPSSIPQTPEQITATEKALGLEPPAPKPADVKPTALAQRAPVRMGVAPQTVEDGWRLAQFISQSDLVPKGYRGRPADVLVAIQYGMEVGLPPMAALHSIYVTNGRPSLFGDGFLAVIMASAKYRDHDEYYVVDGERKEFVVAADLAKDDTMAVTTFWRSDSERPRTATFSVAKAKKAGLWGKSGPWAEYPDRMLKYRARGFAGHDGFPDVLRGIRTAEEVIDMPDDHAIIETAPVVQRISETPKPATSTASAPSPASPAAAQTAEASPSGPVTVGPSAVTAVDQVENTDAQFVVTLANGQALVLTEAADAMAIEMKKGSKEQMTAVCVPSADGKTLTLQSFSFA